MNRQITSDLLALLRDHSVPLKTISQKYGFTIPELCLIGAALALPKRKRGPKAKVQQEQAQ